MLNNRILFTWLIVAFISSTLLAGKSKVGTTAYSFLKIGTDAKALAMGGAFVGLADNENALYYNPAGIVGMRERAVSASYMNYIADIQSGAISFVLPHSTPPSPAGKPEDEEFDTLDVQSAFGISANYLNYGKIDETNEAGQSLGDFGGSDMAFGLSYARKVAPQIALGGTAKFLYQSIDHYSSTGFAVDAGALYRFKDGRTNAGLSASNLGFQLSGLSNEHKDPLPVLVRLGLSHHLRELPVTFSAEGVYPSDNDIYGAVGFEIKPNIPLALRAGYSSFGKNYKSGGDKDKTAGFSFGAGFKLPSIIVDYAFLPYADLGSLHRIGISYRW